MIILTWILNTYEKRSVPCRGEVWTSFSAMQKRGMNRNWLPSHHIITKNAVRIMKVLKHLEQGFLTRGEFSPWGGMEGPEKVILNMSNTSIFLVFCSISFTTLQCRLYHIWQIPIFVIIIKGVLQCILCLWRETDGWIKRVLNSFCRDSFWLVLLWQFS